jgi:hypothetical protein
MEPLRHETRPMLIGVGVSVLFFAIAYVLFDYLPTYVVRQLQLPFCGALQATVVAECFLWETLDCRDGD